MKVWASTDLKYNFTYMKCIHLQELVDELEQRLQSEKTKSEVANEEIAMLNKQNIVNKRQLEESTTRLKEMTEKFDGE